MLILWYYYTMLFVVTGGTIDKMPVFLPDGETFDNDSKVFEETHLPEMLEKARFLGNHSIKPLFMVDSLDMTDEHRAEISAAIEGSDDDKVIVTHGTDTMPVTARFLERNERLAAKTIVLTGAMILYSVGAESDAMFNLGSALAYAQALPSGIYVAMDGQAFEAGNVYKDVEAGVFRTLE
jgi:L-asparaginase